MALTRREIEIVKKNVRNVSFTNKDGNIFICWGIIDKGRRRY
jgi:hypothetical protein